MGADIPDWGGHYNSGQFFPLFDQAELAARLGSIITYDRRGSVLWMYDFSFGIGDVGPAASGAGSTVFLSSQIYESPPFSCVLQAGSADGATASIERRLPVPQSLRVGCQASCRASASVSEIYVNIWHYTGTTRFFSYLLADLDNGVLQVRTAESGLVTILDPLPDLSTGYYFAHLKLVADLSNHQLLRAMLDDHEFDLSAYTMASSASAVAPHLFAKVSNLGHNLVNSTVNVDNLIITAAEPPNA